MLYNAHGLEKFVASSFYDCMHGSTNHKFTTFEMHFYNSALC